jgi:hypothetical protein
MNQESISEILWWKSLAKKATAKAKELELQVRGEFSEIGLDATEVGPYKLTLSHQSVDWNPDIIDTIKSINGVSDGDKDKLFMPVKRKVNGIHVNSIAKKYGSTVSERVLEARSETGEAFKITTDRMENNLIDKSVDEFLETQNQDEIDEEEGENL